MAKTEFENCVDNALENVKNDRALALTLLTDLMKYIKQEEARHREVGLTAAKYLETLQRSNEQLVKLSSLIYKNNNQSTELTLDDKEGLYDLIQNKED